MLDAFAPAISVSVSVSGGDPAFPGVPGTKPDLAKARRDAAAVDQTMHALRTVAPPDADSHVPDSDYLLRDWQRQSRGDTYPRSAGLKQQHDPDGCSSPIAA